MNLTETPWYLPSMYGDIRLTAQGQQTQVEWENLSPSERTAMADLAKKFAFDLTPSGKEAGTIVVPKPIAKVEATLTRAMKRGRKLLTAVAFQNGRIEEVHRTAAGEVVADAKTETADKPRAAVTVAQPALSCPVPEFERANVRATRVLREFLTPAQLADFEARQQFLVIGADSGHRYVLTSRQAPPDQLGRVGGRSVFDATRGQAVCVHDWTVPAAEELLELALFLQMPGHEGYVSTMAFEPLH